jgi:hypothetical protein
MILEPKVTGAMLHQDSATADRTTGDVIASSVLVDTTTILLANIVSVIEAEVRRTCVTRTLAGACAVIALEDLAVTDAHLASTDSPIALNVDVILSECRRTTVMRLVSAYASQTLLEDHVTSARRATTDIPNA